jgi:hypothetical protein
MDPKQKADAFVADLRTVVAKHFDSLPPSEREPFGMRLRQSLPMVKTNAGGGITTTATISIPLDTDPPDSD